MWADPYNEQLCCIASSKAWQLYGKEGYIGPKYPVNSGELYGEGSIGYFLRDGIHYLGRQDWMHYIAFLQSKTRLNQKEYEKDTNLNGITYISPNLFDKDSQNIQTTKYMTDNGWAYSSGDKRLGTTHPIYVEKGKTYRFPSFENVYGKSNSRWVVYVNGIEDLTIIGGSQGVLDNGFIIWTSTQDGYIVANLNIQEKESFMFCEETVFPSYYLPYGIIKEEKIKQYDSSDLLFHKTIVFNGDSIFAASSDIPKELGGWFGRLQHDYQVYGKNYAIGGGTITAQIYNESGDALYWISSNIDTIYEDYPNLDYIIFEGGINDAYRLGEFNKEKTPERFGSWAENNYNGTYDNTTFCGAVEYMFYKACIYWPNAKKGFVIPMKMGFGGEANNAKMYFDEIEKIAQKWHIPVLNLWEKTDVDPENTAYYDPDMTRDENVNIRHFYLDEIHPSSYGYEKLYYLIVEWIKSL